MGEAPPDIPDIIHLVSIEYLYHYRCGACDRWFTIADHYVELVTCPLCGIKSFAFIASVRDELLAAKSDFGPP